MVISTSSWHYKMLNNKLFVIEAWSPSNSLCIYFWQVIFKLFAAFVFLLGISSPAVSLILMTTDWSNPPIIIALLGLFGLIIGGAYIIFSGIFVIVLAEQEILKIKQTYRKKHPKPYKNFQHKESKTNILFSYVKAKKEKVCPIIQFKED